MQTVREPGRARAQAEPSSCSRSTVHGAVPGMRTWSGTRPRVPARCKQCHDTYWNKRAKQPIRRGISWKREEKGWIRRRRGSGSVARHGRLPRRARGTAAASAQPHHSPARLGHLEAAVAQHDLAGRQGLPRTHLHRPESGGAERHGGHRSASTPWGARSQARYRRGTDAGRGQALVPEHLREPGNLAVWAQTEPKMV